MSSLAELDIVTEADRGPGPGHTLLRHINRLEQNYLNQGHQMTRSSPHVGNVNYDIEGGEPSHPCVCERASTAMMPAG